MKAARSSVASIRSPSSGPDTARLWTWVAVKRSWSVGYQLAIAVADHCAPPSGPPSVRSRPSRRPLEGIVLFLVLRLLTHRFGALGRPRLVGGAFIFLYGCARIFVEFFRMPDAQLGYLLGTGWVTMGMVLSVPMLLVGLWATATAKPRAYEPRPAETPVSA